MQACNLLMRLTHKTKCFLVQSYAGKYIHSPAFCKSYFGVAMASIHPFLYFYNRVQRTSGQSTVHRQNLAICQYPFCAGSTLRDTPLGVGHSRVLRKALGVRLPQACFVGQPVSQGPARWSGESVFKDEGQSPATAGRAVLGCISLLDVPWGIYVELPLTLRLLYVCMNVLTDIIKFCCAHSII